MKTVTKIFAFALFVSFLFNGCTSNNRDSKDLAESQNKTTFKDDKQDKKDAQFVVDVAAANYYEIGLSKYAVKSTVNNDVKSFAGMMVSDHSAALNKLKLVAQKQNISIPDEDTANVNSKIKSWQKKTPAEFNKAYIDEMVDEHKATVNKLVKEDSVSSNSDIKGWIEATLPTVREHLQKVTDIQDKMK